MIQAEANLQKPVQTKSTTAMKFFKTCLQTERTQRPIICTTLHMCIHHKRLWRRSVVDGTSPPQLQDPTNSKLCDVDNRGHNSNYCNNSTTSRTAILPSNITLNKMQKELEIRVLSMFPTHSVLTLCADTWTSSPANNQIDNPKYKE